MSEFVNFGQVADRLLVTEDAVAAPAALGAFSYDPANDALMVDGSGAIATHANGMPFTAEGRLAVEFDAKTANGAVRGLAFADGRLLMNDGNPVVGHVAGWPVSVLGRVCIVRSGPPPDPPGSFTLFPLSVDEGVTNDVLVEWGFSVGVTSYRVYRDAVLIATVPSSENDYTDPFPGFGTFLYAVVAVNSGGTTASTPASRSITVAVAVAVTRQVYAVAAAPPPSPVTLASTGVVVWAGGGQTYVDTLVAPDVTPFNRASLIIDALIAGDIPLAQLAIAVAAIVALSLATPVYEVHFDGTTYTVLVGPPPGYTEAYNWPGWPPP